MLKSSPLPKITLFPSLKNTVEPNPTVADEPTRTSPVNVAIPATTNPSIPVISLTPYLENRSTNKPLGENAET